MKKSNIIKYSTLSLVSICAIVAVVLLASTAIAHGCSYGDSYCYSGGTPVYSYNNMYQYPTSYSPMSPLTASCYSSPITTYVGNVVQWSSSVNGGAGTYNITWYGDEGLSGYGSSISKSYNTIGSKSASMTVVSGGQTISVNCSDTINVLASPYGYSYYNNNNYNSYNNSNNYATLSANCTPNITYAGVGSTVTWTATVSGGNGFYTYAWYGSDGIYGSNQSTTFTYNTIGTKSAYVIVTSNGQTTTSYCTNAVTIAANYNYNNNYSNNYGVTYPTTYVVNQSNTANTLDIGCYVDPSSSVSINQPVTWSTEVTGGAAPYTYSWTGSDNLTGTQSSVIKYYSTSGSKNAIVTVTSADGKTGTRACSNAVAVRAAAGATVARNTGTTVAATTGTRTVTTITTATTPASSNVSTQTTGTNGTNGTNATANQNGQNGSPLSASSIFSFDNVPWGWIAVLIILVLFGTVMYLLFNRQKI